MSFDPEGKRFAFLADDRRWLVVFLRYRVHWTMRWVTKRTPGYEHVLLLSPIGNGQFLSLQWGMDGLFARPMGEVAAARHMDHATEILEYRRVGLPRSSVLNSLLPNTCMTMARQALGLPPRWNFFASGLALRGELLARGATELMAPKGSKT